MLRALAQPLRESMISHRYIFAASLIVTCAAQAEHQPAGLAVVGKANFDTKVPSASKTPGPIPYLTCTTCDPGGGGGGGAPPPDSTAVIDASGGNVMFPLPTSPMSFASDADLGAYLQQQLSAVIIYDANGSVVGAEGKLIQIGHTFYLDGQNAVQRITDPVAAMVGGISGQFVVAGSQRHTSVQGVDSLVSTYDHSLQPPSGTVASSVRRCISSPAACTSGNSWTKHWPAGFYHSVGLRSQSRLRGLPRESLILYQLVGLRPLSMDLHHGLRL